MHYEVFRRLVLDDTNRPSEVSPAFPMEGFDAAVLSTVLSRLTATSVSLKLLQCNDKNNWDPVSGSTETVSSEGYAPGTARTGLAMTWLRVKAEHTGTGLAILDVDINLSKQD